MQPIQRQNPFFLPKHTVICFAVFLLIIFVPGSCAVADNNYNIVFNLTKQNNEIALDSSLLYGSTYLLVASPRGDGTLTTADYDITYNPPNALRIRSKNTNSITFKLYNTGAKAVIVTATHRDNTAVTDTLVLRLSSPDTPTTDFSKDIQGTVVPTLATSAELTRAVFEPLGAVEGKPLEKRYVTESGAGTQNGKSWENAWAATNARNGIAGINDAGANKIYLVMLTDGTYKPTYATADRTVSFSMKNYMIIMGGFEEGGGWARTGTTVFSGEIGNVGIISDNSYNVFRNNGALGNAHMYEVDITGGNANGSAGTAQQGGGMYNNGSSPILTKVLFVNNNAMHGGGMYNNSSSSPVLTRVVFRSNSSTQHGGGMHNDRSSPFLNRTVFIGNSGNYGGGMHNDRSSPFLSNTIFINNSGRLGGGMYNIDSSSPVLTTVVFDGNTAQGGAGAGAGGGMYNISSSSPVLTSVVFNGNTANNGGGMYSRSSFPIIIGSVFKGNSGKNGGGILNDRGGELLIVNTIFADNSVDGSGDGPDIAVDRGSHSNANIRIAGSVLGIGLASPVNGIVGYNDGGSSALNITYHSLANGVVNFGDDITVRDIPYPTIQSASSARNIGLFVRKSGTTYYFSQTGIGATWYTAFTATGGLSGVSANSPTNAEDLTATDIVGNARNGGRPDAGVFEVQ